MSVLCLAALCGRRDDESDESDRALVGAAVVGEALHELRTIREILCEVLKKGG